MLPNSARIKSSSDFARVTKSGRRVSTESLVAYLLTSTNLTATDNTGASIKTPTKLGLIVGKSIGNSVTRHRIARQIRHASFELLEQLPIGSMLVIRAMRRPTDAFNETKELYEKLIRPINNRVSA